MASDEEALAEPREERAPLRVARAEPAPLGEGALLSLLAHELRTPIQSIALAAEVSLLRLRGAADGVPTAWMVERLEQIDRAARSLRGIVEMVLGAAQLDAGQLQVHREPLDLAEIARGHLSRARDDFAWAGCAISLDAPAAVRGCWDRLLVELIVGNLISNALKYGAARPVAVAVYASPERAVFSVSDRGPGIAAADQARIFERFVRLPSASVVPGAGLGLWLAHHAARALGGSIKVESELGHGARFTVELPL